MCMRDSWSLKITPRRWARFCFFLFASSNMDATYVQKQQLVVSLVNVSIPQVVTYINTFPCFISTSACWTQAFLLHFVRRWHLSPSPPPILTPSKWLPCLSPKNLGWGGYPIFNPTDLSISHQDLKGSFKSLKLAFNSEMCLEKKRIHSGNQT